MQIIKSIAGCYVCVNKLTYKYNSKCERGEEGRERLTDIVVVLSTEELWSSSAAQLEHSRRVIRVMRDRARNDWNDWKYGEFREIF